MKQQQPDGSPQRKEKKRIVIVGTGPTGLLLAHSLIRRRNYEITMIEKRPDPRIEALENPQTMRSFPIALNQRGLSSLRQYSLQKHVDGVYLRGVCLHAVHKSQNYKAPHTILRETPSLSVDRNRLTLNLLEQLVTACPAEGTSLTIRFETALEEIHMGDDDNHDSNICVRNYQSDTKEVIEFHHLVAADGSNSKIRRHLVQQRLLECTEQEIPDDYRALFLARQSEDGAVQLDDDMLHGWMARTPSLKIITAPVIAGCLSGVIVFDKGQDPFVNMNSPQDVKNWFQELCPSSLAKLVSDKEAAQLLARPTSTTLAVRCNHLYVRNVLLMGDAAHAMSASVGQGCNSALQDVIVFTQLLDRYQDDWGTALVKYSKERMPDIHAVADLSEYSTPRSRWMKIEWILRTILRKVIPTWIATFILRPLPMELLMETDLPYRDVLSRTQWWVDRVKKTFPSSTTATKNTIKA
jgi:kynurenine 3-monooxygenase